MLIVTNGNDAGLRTPRGRSGLCLFQKKKSAPDIAAGAALNFFGIQKGIPKISLFRQVGFDPIQQEQMVLAYIDKHGSIKRAEVMDLCRIIKDQAYKL